MISLFLITLYDYQFPSSGLHSDNSEHKRIEIQIIKFLKLTELIGNKIGKMIRI